MFDIYPRDEQALFESPLAVPPVTCTGVGNPLKLVSFDPDRVILVMGVITGNAVTFGLDPAMGTGVCFTLAAGTNGVILMSYKDYGPLVTYAWFVSGAVMQSAGAIAVSLRRDPAMYGFGKAFLRRETNTLALPVQPSLVKPRSRRTISLPPAVLAAIRSKCPLILGEG